MRDGRERVYGGVLAAMLAGCVCGAGCATSSGMLVDEWTIHDAVQRYHVAQGDQLAAFDPSPGATGLLQWTANPLAAHPPFTLGMFGEQDDSEATSQPAGHAAAGDIVPPAGYWRKNLWHQMGHEAKLLGGHDFWRGFKTSFWDVENALLLTATMGASITIRETGVDHAIRRRTRGHRQLGDLDEPIQLLGNPATHFAATGVLWLGSALTKDVRQHEVAKSLTQALAVNGATTLLLKAAANTRAPDGDGQAWPSGHTSSAFAAAAVLNEHYGPLVGIPSLALAGLVGYQRIDSRVHDFSDVVFGGMLGYVIGTSIARDEKARFPELFGMKVIPYADPETGASGLALYKQW